MLLLKLTLVPLTIIFVSFAAKRWGALIGGLLSGLPIVAGPITLFLSLENGTEFAVISTKATLLGTIALCVFCFIYSWCATKFGWFFSLLISWIVYFFTSIFLSMISINIHLTLALLITSTILLRRLMPKTEPATKAIIISKKQMMLRVIASVFLVLLITKFASSLGPNLSGIYAVFPVIASILAVFTHVYNSSNETLIILKGLMLGILSLAGFYYSLNIISQWINFYNAFMLSIGIVLMLQFVSLKFIKVKS